MLFLELLAIFVAAGICAAGLNHLALIPWRKKQATHWTEQARTLYPIRKSAAANIWMIAINSCLVFFVICSPQGNHLLLAAISGYAGATLGTYFLDHELFPRFTFKAWLNYVLFSLGSRLLIWGGLLAMAIYMPDTFNATSLILGVIFFGFLVSWICWLWIWSLKLFKLLLPPPQRLADIVAAASKQSGLRYRFVWRLHSPIGYAAAVVTTGELIFSDGILETLSDEELASVCAHELAHLAEPKSVILLRVLVGLWIYPLIFIKPAAIQYGPLAVIFLLLTAYLVVRIAQWQARRMEIRADSVGKAQESQAGVYARALEKLYQFNQTPAVMPRENLAHPHLYDRIVAAGITPNYPRPDKPEASSWHGAMMQFLLFLLIILALARLATPKHEDSQPNPTESTHYSGPQSKQPLYWPETLR